MMWLTWQMSVPDEAMDLLNKGGIRRVVVGHTPHGTCPTIIKAGGPGMQEPGLVVVMADTSFSDMKAADNRGSAVSEVQLLDNGEVRAFDALTAPIHTRDEKSAPQTMGAVPILTPQTRRSLPQRWVQFPSSHHRREERSSNDGCSSHPHTTAEKSAPPTMGAVPILTPQTRRALPQRWVQFPSSHHRREERSSNDGCSSHPHTTDESIQTCSPMYGRHDAACAFATA
jgi:hypothetical protein